MKISLVCGNYLSSKEKAIKISKLLFLSGFEVLDMSGIKQISPIFLETLLLFKSEIYFYNLDPVLLDIIRKYFSTPF